MSKQLYVGRNEDVCLFRNLIINSCYHTCNLWVVIIFAVFAYVLIEDCNNVLPFFK